MTSPDGSALTLVNLTRRPLGENPAGSITNRNISYFLYYASSQVIPPTDQNSYCDPDLIPNSATSWLGNMLYAPVDQVQVCVTTARGGFYCSSWH